MSFLKKTGTLFGAIFLLFYLLILPLLAEFVSHESMLILSGVPVGSLFVSALLALPLALLLKDDLAGCDFCYRFAVTYLISLLIYVGLRQLVYFDSLIPIYNTTYPIINMLLLLIVAALHLPALLGFVQKHLFWGIVLCISLILLLPINLCFPMSERLLSSLVLMVCLMEALAWQLLAVVKTKEKWLFWLSAGFTAMLHIIALGYLYNRYVDFSKKLELELLAEQRQEEEMLTDESQLTEPGQNEAVRYPWKGPQRAADSVRAYFIEYLRHELKYDYYADQSVAQATIDFTTKFKALALEEPGYLYNPQATSEDVDPAGLYLNDVALYIGRDSTRLLSFYYGFREVLHGLIRPEVYRNDIRSSVKMLLRSSAIIYLPNYTILSNRIYAELDTVRAMEDRMQILQNMLGQENLSVPQEDLHASNKAQVYWAYTFWARRCRERNTEAVYKILFSIDEYYNASENESNPTE